MKKYSIPFIDILKMDIEGAEKFIFDSEEKVKSFLLHVEFHPE